jgi:hypothetical protein
MPAQTGTAGKSKMTPREIDMKILAEVTTWIASELEMIAQIALDNDVDKLYVLNLIDRQLACTRPS